MLYPQSIYDLASEIRYFAIYLKIKNAMIKLSSYNYKHDYKTREM